MGTRGTIHFIDTDGRKVLSIHVQYDCYLSGLGEELVKLLKNSTIVNGYSMNQKSPKFFNGIGCASAWVLSQLKEGIGGYYCTTSKDRQEYNYFLTEISGAFHLRVTDWENKVLYRGPLTSFDGYKLEGRPRPSLGAQA